MSDYVLCAPSPARWLKRNSIISRSFPRECEILPVVISSHRNRPRSVSLLRKSVISASISSTSTTQPYEQSTWSHVDELHLLLSLLPPLMSQSLLQISTHGDTEPINNLVEIILDLGRKPIARFVSGDISIWENPVTTEDLQYAVSQVGEFGGDNRAGIDRTLHRISAIRNRSGKIVGLTCRVGRSVPGSADMARDLIKSGGSLLLMGPPGVGKTTTIREVARMLAGDFQKRVVIVDTSNEIGGDGDIPHGGIGRARRMQVPRVDLQHHVMIEAVENHMPECIVIDEIGTELEAMAAGTIAQRGVQLVGTAHGMTIDNLIKNPSLQNLVGGIQSVTLGDEEARRRGVQKSVLERKGPPVFTTAVEMVSREMWRVHTNLTQTVDALLAGRTPTFEIRRMESDGRVSSKKQSEIFSTNIIYGSSTQSSDGLQDGPLEDGTLAGESDSDEDDNMYSLQAKFIGPLLVYPLEIDSEALDEVIGEMKLEASVKLTTDLSVADVVLALKSKLRGNTWVRGMAKFRQLPIFAIKSNTTAQMTRALRTILEMSSNLLTGEDSDAAKSHLQIGMVADSNRPGWNDENEAIEEATAAIEEIVIKKQQPVELQPRSLPVLQAQMILVEQYQLQSETVGANDRCRIRILPKGFNLKVPSSGGRDGWGAMANGRNDSESSVQVKNLFQPGSSVDRLPILED